MKKFNILLVALFAIAACTSEYDKMMNDSSRAGKPGEDEFYATVEDTGSADPQTKVYADEQMRVLWNAGDTISIFKKTTLNRPYRFTGPEGSNAGGFTELPNSDEFITENPLNYNYAIYPYRKETVMSYDGVLTVDMPEVQVYKEHSFGMGANTMVSVTEDNILQFKNAGGYLSFKFYGDGVLIKNITLKGNNHEKLAGAAKVTMSPGGLPVVTMQGTATEGITLFCAEPVALGVDSEHYTEFWFVVPPTEFTKGFTVTVTDRRGGIFTTSTTSAVSVARNTLSRMAPMEVAPEYQYVPFDDANFKAYCVSNFDRNSDGEISMKEANNITSIDVRTTDITSLGGIEFMPNLNYLRCPGESSNNRGKLTSLDVSENTALQYLYCGNNQLTSLDVRKNGALQSLDCDYNQLTSLDVSKNEALQSLYCNNNQLTSLDVSKNTALTHLQCSNNQLTSLNVSKNTEMTELRCYNNQLNSLILGQNTALQIILCGNNQLKSLDVSQNTALQALWCSNNQLTSLDVSKNTALQGLYCNQNRLNSLEISANTALTELDCSLNFLNSLDVSHFSSLSYLNCACNYISLLDLSRHLSLTELDCTSNQLTSLDVSNNTALTILYCEINELSSLNVSQNTAIQTLLCKNNQLASLDVSNNTALTCLDCSANQIGALNLSYNSELSQMYCQNNPRLKSIWIRPGQTFERFEYDSNVATIYDCFANFEPFNIASDYLKDKIMATATSATTMLASIGNLKQAVDKISGMSFPSLNRLDSIELFDAIVAFSKAREEFLDFKTTVRNINPQDPTKRDSSLFYYSKGKTADGNPILTSIRFSALNKNDFLAGEYEFTTANPGDVKFVEGYPDEVVNAFANIVDQLGSELSTMFDFANHAFVSPTVITNLSTALYGRYKIDSWRDPKKVLQIDGSEYVPRSLIDAESRLADTLIMYINIYNRCWNTNVSWVERDNPIVLEYIRALKSGNTDAIEVAKNNLIDFMAERCPTDPFKP